MAPSSDPERDKAVETQRAPPKPDNPFIRFRQFADQQISSLLQGVFGIPSAFSGRPQENSKWAVFDEDLRRRDELHARQQQLKGSEVERRLNSQAAVQDGNGTGKDASNWSYVSLADSTKMADADSDGVRDMPLYSPVTKSLFAHLHQPTDGSTDWKELDLSKLFRPSPILPRSANALRTFQYLIYDDLNESPKLRSNYSLLPYLLFSPYSPIRLTDQQPTSESPNAFEINYLDAFEDLIRTTQPPRPFSPFLMLSRNLPSSDRFLFARAGFDTSVLRSLTYHSWIWQLHNHSLLQEKDVKSLPRFSVPRYDQNDLNSKPSKEVHTEQDMYDNFFRWLSHYNTDDLDSFLAAAKNTFGNYFESNNFRGMPMALDEFMNSMSMNELLQRFDPSKQYQTKLLADENERAPDAERILMEHTETRRIKQADGSVHTHVSVWKKFADGRETTTTTSHVEEQERHDNGTPKALKTFDNEPNAMSGQRAADSVIENKKTQKKGWFWN